MDTIAIIPFYPHNEPWKGTTATPALPGASHLSFRHWCPGLGLCSESPCYNTHPHAQVPTSTRSSHFWLL